MPSTREYLHFFGLDYDKRAQVEMGVAVRMARLENLTSDLGNGPPVA